MPMIRITTSNSMRVNPRSSFARWRSLNSIESSWIRVVCTGASATHDDSHPSVLAFLASRIDLARKNLEPMQENFSALIQRIYDARSYRAAAPAAARQ